MNTLLATYNTPFETIPFDEIKPEHFGPAFEEAFREAREQVHDIAENHEEPTFQNTIAGLEESGEKLNDLAAVLFNLNHAETSDALQKLALEIAPQLTEFKNEISHNNLLFRRVKTVAETADKALLSAEQRMLLDNTLKGFLRSGAALEKKECTCFHGKPPGT